MARIKVFDPTKGEWVYADMSIGGSAEVPSGGGGGENNNNWELINTVSFAEEGITSFVIDKDLDGKSFELCDMCISSNYHASLGGESANSARTNFMINGKRTAFSMGNLSHATRTWLAIGTLINNRVYYGYTDFANNTSDDAAVPIRPMQDNLGGFYDDDSITSVGINILNPGTSYFDVGYVLSLWGRRKK